MENMTITIPNDNLTFDDLQEEKQLFISKAILRRQWAGVWPFLNSSDSWQSEYGKVHISDTHLRDKRASAVLRSANYWRYLQSVIIL